MTGKDTADKGDIVQAIGNDYTLLRNCADFKGIWAGSDESGKGDFFGPLVVAAVLVDITTAEKLVRLGVRDYKLINDKEVAAGRADCRSCSDQHGFSFEAGNV